LRLFFSSLFLTLFSPSSFFCRAARAWSDSFSSPTPPVTIERKVSAVIFSLFVYLISPPSSLPPHAPPFFFFLSPDSAPICPFSPFPLLSFLNQGQEAPAERFTDRWPPFPFSKTFLLIHSQQQRGFPPPQGKVAQSPPPLITDFFESRPHFPRRCYK